MTWKKIYKIPFWRKNENINIIWTIFWGYKKCLDSIFSVFTYQWQKIKKKQITKPNENRIFSNLKKIEKNCWVNCSTRCGWDAVWLSNPWIVNWCCCCCGGAVQKKTFEVNQSCVVFVLAAQLSGIKFVVELQLLCSAYSMSHMISGWYAQYKTYEYVCVCVYL